MTKRGKNTKGKAYMRNHNKIVCIFILMTGLSGCKLDEMPARVVPQNVITTSGYYLLSMKYGGVLEAKYMTQILPSQDSCHKVGRELIKSLPGFGSFSCTPI
mgnify:CR=1 FL=1